MMTLKEILAKINGWAPPGIAQSYDNVGLQVGDPNQEVRLGLIALELTPAVIHEAEDLGAQLIVTHHPLLFRPLKSLTPATLVGSMTLQLARSGIGLIAAHTNLDAVKDGVSAALAARIGLADPQLLAPFSEGIVKLVTFVPEAHLEAVRAAVSRAGAGQIGDYSDVAFVNMGEGLFRPLASANPFIGSPGGTIERVAEWRLEAAIPRDRLAAVVNALVDAHPYETPVYDVYELTDTVSGYGLGMIGDMGQSMTLSDFLSHVSDRLKTKALRYAGAPSASVRRVAVCGGAGRDLIGLAAKNGADAYITSDITYHSFFDVMNSDGSIGMALIDAGHYETEVDSEQLLQDWLTNNTQEVTWVRTDVRTSPVETFIQR